MASYMQNVNFLPSDYKINDHNFQNDDFSHLLYASVQCTHNKHEH